MSIDNDQMEVGLLLALVGDPSAALFSNKALSPLSKGRAFAPMAEQLLHKELVTPAAEEQTL